MDEYTQWSITSMANEQVTAYHQKDVIYTDKPFPSGTKILNLSAMPMASYLLEAPYNFTIEEMKPEDEKKFYSVVRLTNAIVKRTALIEIIKNSTASYVVGHQQLNLDTIALEQLGEAGVVFMTSFNFNKTHPIPKPPAPEPEIEPEP